MTPLAGIFALTLGGALVSLPTPQPLGPQPQADVSCITMNTERTPLARRPSPLDSLTLAIDDGAVKICYSRPSARGRTMIGASAVPYGKLWRTGANEPTMIHTTVPVTVAGIRVEPGSYSLYTVPGEQEWEVIVNRSITQWGHESRYTDEVKAQEVGRGKVSSTPMDDHVEMFTIRAEPTDAGATIFIEWEHTQVAIPIAKG
ncbi:MAG: DUF2911 domain-containing protein [Gemmatimonadota bacterium]|nr:DUF2911 domain-containing protein [Gemmatimonadota bacterium]MDH3368589.1 DUF2911 domain-containing protein [Gemmatimonadota bacterium]MDH3478383.1 DUF2911 domain-containing protein [Gemmatimonadota bacterium]MDH3571508.1 DUF2911 domain-containing protein [Gemmatimonadota bacterium]MDH5548931.1 DUF2911 domain-containing protein [Gemmatimonadota bacterium]